MRSFIIVDGGGVVRDGILRVFEFRSSSFSLFDSINIVIRIFLGIGLGDLLFVGFGIGGLRMIIKKIIICRISLVGSDLGFDGFGIDFGISLSIFVVGDIGIFLGNDIGIFFIGDIGIFVGGGIGIFFGIDGI